MKDYSKRDQIAQQRHNTPVVKALIGLWLLSIPTWAVGAVIKAFTGWAVLSDLGGQAFIVLLVVATIMSSAQPRK